MDFYEEPMSMDQAQKEKYGETDYILKLKKELDKDILAFNEDMSKYCSFKAGGKCKVLITPRNKMELINALEILSNSKCMVIGNGSNILVQDGGYDGAIIKIGKEFANISVSGEEIKVSAGALLSTVSKRALEHSLTGMEFASGIPGSIGGAVFMNAGAYDGEMKDIVKEVRVISKDGKDERILFPRDLKFAYRESSIMKTDDIVLQVTLKLKKGDEKEIAARMKILNEKRNDKQPVEYPSGGSFFKRPKNNFAGKLIEDCNLKGFSVNGAMISKKHAGFLINYNNATASDIVNLMTQVVDIVKEKTGVTLEPEIRIIGDNTNDR